MSGFNNLSDWFTEMMSPTMMQQGENMYTANARQNAEITNKYFNPMANTYSASPALGDWAKNMFDNPNIGKYGQPLNGGMGGMGDYNPFTTMGSPAGQGGQRSPMDTPIFAPAQVTPDPFGGGMAPTVPATFNPNSMVPIVPTAQGGNPLISNPNYMDAAMGSALNQQLAGNSNIAGLDAQMQSHFDGIDAAGGLKNQNFLQGFGGGMFDEYTNKDLIGGGLSMFQAGMGLYNDFRNFGLEEDKVDIQRGALNLSREKYADSVADKELRIAQNKRTNG